MFTMPPIFRGKPRRANPPRPRRLPALVMEWTGPEGDRPLPKRFLKFGKPMPPPVAAGLAPRFAAQHKPEALAPLDLSEAMAKLFADLASCLEELRHIDPAQTLVTVSRARTARRVGLMAKVTPLRFREGALVESRHGRLYQVQRYKVADAEILYLVTFCLPRFLQQSFEEKLTTVVHELFHIAPAFNGDLRRHHGRYCIHTARKKGYDARMKAMAEEYLRRRTNHQAANFLRWSPEQLIARHGAVRATVVPMPKLVPLT